MKNKIILRILEENKGKEIFFWGASNFLKEFLLKNDLSKYKIKGIFDNNKKLHGKTFKYKVSEFKKIDKDKTRIIFTVKNNHGNVYKQVFDELDKKGFSGCLLPDPFLEFENTYPNALYLIDKSGKKTLVDNIPGLKIIWKGANSKITIGTDPAPKFLNSRIVIYSNSSIEINSSKYSISNLDVEVTDNSKIKIGEDFSCYQVGMYVKGEEGKKITIGKDCMFSYEIVVRTSDTHTIIDKLTNKVLNEGKDVKIGDHVWVAKRVSILKGSSIPDGCIIGTDSLVNKKLKEKDAVYVGYPVKMVRQDILWKREDVDTYKRNLLFE